MKKLAKELLRCMHEGYVVRKLYAHHFGRKEWEDGAWIAVKFSYDNPTAPRFLVDLVADHPDGRQFPDDRGYELEADGLMTAVPDFTYMHCLTPKGRAAAESLFGPAQDVLFVREPGQVPSLTERETTVLNDLLDLRIPEEEAMADLGIDFDILQTLLRVMETEHGMHGRVSAWYRARPQKALEMPFRP